MVISNHFLCKDWVRHPIETTIYFNGWLQGVLGISNHEPVDFLFGKLPSCKLTFRHGKSTILMVFTRKDGDFHGRAVSLPEGM